MRRSVYRLLGDATAYLCALGDTWGYWSGLGKGRWWHAPIDAVAYRVLLPVGLVGTEVSRMSQGSRVFVIYGGDLGHLGGSSKTKASIGNSGG